MAGARARLQVLLVLTALGGDSGFEVLFIKNRLMLEFDADAAGGYRDMLINLQCRESGHMVEVGAGPSPYCRACLGRRCIRTTCVAALRLPMHLYQRRAHTHLSSRAAEATAVFLFCPPPFLSAAHMPTQPTRSLTDPPSVRRCDTTLPSPARRRRR